MQITTTNRLTAGGAGVLSATAALAIMISDVEPLNPNTWRLDHALMPVVLLITVIAGHFVGLAPTYRNRAAWLLVFVVGSSVTLYQSLGRQHATVDQQIKLAEASNTQRADVTKQIIATGLLLDKALSAQAANCEKAPDSERCKGARQNVRSFTAAIERYQQQLLKIGPEQTPAPKATRLAATVALFATVDEQRLREKIIALEPFAFTILFEVGSIVAFGFAFRARTDAPAQHPSATVGHSETVTPSNQQPTRPTPRKKATVTEPDARAVVVSLRRIGTQQELADRLGVHKGTVSRWMQQWEAEGILTRTADGRTKAAATHI